MHNRIGFQKLIVMVIFLAVAVSCSEDETVTAVLITSDRATGTIYSINLKTGGLKSHFTPMYNGAPLNDVRGIVYHPTEKQFYVSVNSYADFGNGTRKGGLFKMDPKTHIATLINDNDGKVNPGDPNQSYEIWNAIVNWAVSADDSLVAVGDFNADGRGFVKFGSDGARGVKTVIADVCCGLGMIYEPSTKKALLGNGANQADGTLDFETFDTVTGASDALVTISTFNGFPDSFNLVYTTSTYTIKGLATRNAGYTMYALMFDASNNGETYFVTVNLNTKEVDYIATIGADFNNQYSALTFVRSDLL